VWPRAREKGPAGGQEIVARAGTLTDVDASAFGSPIDHAHWRDRRGLRPGAEIPDYLADVVDPTTGVVDDEQLSRKLDLLAGALRSQAYGRQFWAKARPVTGLPPTRLS
jgi:hypothetical protein